MKKNLGFIMAIAALVIFFSLSGSVFAYKDSAPLIRWREISIPPAPIPKRGRRPVDPAKRHRWRHLYGT